MKHFAATTFIAICTLTATATCLASNEGLFLGANGIYGEYDAKDLSIDGTNYTPDSKTIYGGGITAGFNASKRLAIELGLEGITSVDYNTNSDISPSQRIGFVFADIKPMIQGHNMVGFARLGAAYLSVETDDDNDATDDSTSKVRPMVGLGFGVNTSPEVEIDLSVNRIQDSEQPMNFVMLEFTYHFIQHYNDSGFLAD